MVRLSEPSGGAGVIGTVRGGSAGTISKALGTATKQIAGLRKQMTTDIALDAETTNDMEHWPSSDLAKFVSHFPVPNFANLVLAEE